MLLFFQSEKFKNSVLKMVPLFSDLVVLPYACIFSSFLVTIFAVLSLASVFLVSGWILSTGASEFL